MPSPASDPIESLSRRFPKLQPTFESEADDVRAFAFKLALKIASRRTEVNPQGFLNAALFVLHGLIDGEPEVCPALDGASEASFLRVLNYAPTVATALSYDSSFVVEVEKHLRDFISTLDSSNADVSVGRGELIMEFLNRHFGILEEVVIEVAKCASDLGWKFTPQKWSSDPEIRSGAFVLQIDCIEPNDGIGLVLGVSRGWSDRLSVRIETPIGRIVVGTLGHQDTFFQPDRHIPFEKELVSALAYLGIEQLTLEEDPYRMDDYRLYQFRRSPRGEKLPPIVYTYSRLLRLDQSNGVAWGFIHSLCSLFYTDEWRNY